MSQGLPPRVLIVEDNSILAMDLQDVLESHGCAIVGPTASIAETSEVIERGNIDIALVDFLLSDGNAEPLAKLLDEKSIPFAICTGMHEREMSLRYPNTPILSKPYDPDDVCRVVDSLIAGRLGSA